MRVGSHSWASVVFALLAPSRLRIVPAIPASGIASDGSEFSRQPWRTIYSETAISVKAMAKGRYFVLSSGQQPFAASLFFARFAGDVTVSLRI